MRLRSLHMPFGRPPGGPQYYVATTGDNGNAGTLASPWADLSYACGQVSVPGSVIHVAAGAYTDNTAAVLAPGVEVRGAGMASVTITSNVTRYLRAYSNASGPVIEGGNEISGITFNGAATANSGVVSYGRHNQLIHDNTFENYTGTNPRGLEVWGKYGYNGTGTFWRNDCIIGTSETGSHCQNDRTLSVALDADEYADGVEIYDNVFSGCGLFPQSLVNMDIHDNTVTNAPRAIGGTGIWFRGGEVYNNTMTMTAVSNAVIAMELWEVSENVKIHDNSTNGWYSIAWNTAGQDVETYSLSIYDNVADSALTSNSNEAFELPAQDVNCYGNYVTGPNAFNYGMTVWRGANAAIVGGNVNIHHNVFFDWGTSHGLMVEAGADAGADLDGVYIYNNVFHNPTTNKDAIFIAVSVAGGKVDDVKIRNNVFWDGRNCVTLFDSFGTGSTIGGVTPILFSNNITYLMADGLSDWTTAATWTEENNTEATDPELTASGAKPSPYYTPPNATANTVNAGVDVGLVYKGSAPDFGAYEWDE